ncbi:MAG: DUF975 family protein [Verrucomicrobia bacterium]|nr:DUF975 family protein [Verrucomicrobiota bacterium]
MWYYIEEGQQRGPVADADMGALLAGGKINSETMVWREGMANWQPWREVQPKAEAPPTISPQVFPTIGASAGAGQVTCSQCGGSFPESEIIRYSGSAVCAGCKPAFLQRLREGSFTGGSTTAGWVSEAQVRERDYDHEVGEYFSKAWQLFKSDAGGLIGATVVVGLCLIVANIIPYLGTITGIIFSGPLMGGLFFFYLKKIRSEEASMGDAFSGFGPRFGQMLLAKFIPGLLAGLALVPVAIIAVLLFVFSAQGAHASGGSGSLMSVPVIIAGVLVLAGLCVMVYLQYCWMFTLWLVADKEMTFWPAMSLSRAVVRKHWWQTFWLGIVTGLLVLLGALLCGLGLLVTGPVCLAMWAYAFERLFGDMQPA